MTGVAVCVCVGHEQPLLLLTVQAMTTMLVYPVTGVQLPVVYEILLHVCISLYQYNIRQ
jgi:hypothetical protein